MKYVSPTAVARYSIGSPIAVAVAVLGLAVIPALLYITYTINYHNQHNRLEESTAQISQDIDEQIDTVNSIMSSLIGFHYTNKDATDNDLSMYAKELRTQADFITDIGRYDFVSDKDRASFENRMSEKGLFNFRIAEITDNGRPKIRTTLQSYYPISFLEPLLPQNARMLGVDLTVLENFQSKLDNITATNSSTLSHFPKNWPLEGNLALFAPVYLGNAAPSMSSERMQQSAGGFWISVNVKSLVAGLNPNVLKFDVTAELEDAGVSKIVYGQLGIDTQDDYLSSLYKRKNVEKKWRIGNSALSFSIQHDLGFTKSSLAYFLTALIGILGVTSLFTVYILSRRSAAQAQHNSQKALFRERERAEKTLNSVQDAIVALDSDIKVVHINPAAAAQFDTTLATALGSSIDNIIQFRAVGEGFSTFNIEEALSAATQHGNEGIDVTPLRCKDADFVLRLTINSSIDPVTNAITGYVLVLRDISQQRILSKKLAYQANHDALTGCTNRHYFENTLNDLVNALPGTKAHHALCYIDLDQFKIINDTCGHPAGDQLLIDLTNNLQVIISENDVLSRLGGDEFGLIMINVNEQQAEERTKKVFDFFQNYAFQYDGKAFAVRASIGVVHIDESFDNLKGVLASADIACYTAKDSGRNCIYFYSATDDAIAERSVELSWLPRLRSALENDDFTLLIQAVASVEKLCNNNTRAIEHYEFLIRMENSDGTLSTPWQFIRAAERYDLITEIDRWVIRNGFRMVAELHSSPEADYSFSINLSGQSAADATLIDYIEEQLEIYQINPSQIWFEITETAAISNFSVAVELINRVRALGFLVALDDFGSGLSSFGYLKNLPVDILKIDGQFVKEIAKNPIDREMVRAIHHVGQSMGIQTVAEFVEDGDIVKVLSEIGVQYAQGYYIAKPMTMEEAFETNSGNFKQAA